MLRVMQYVDISDWLHIIIETCDGLLPENHHAIICGFLHMMLYNSLGLKGLMNSGPGLIWDILSIYQGPCYLGGLCSADGWFGHQWVPGIWLAGELCVSTGYLFPKKPCSQN